MVQWKSLNVGKLRKMLRKSGSRVVAQLCNIQLDEPVDAWI